MQRVEAHRDGPRADGIGVDGDEVSDHDSAIGRSRRRAPGLGVVCAVLLLIAGAALYIRVADSSKPRVEFCAGVGLISPPGSSPDEALAAFLGTRDGQPPASDWRRRGLDFENKTYDQSGGYGLRSVQVSRGGNGWPPAEPYTADQWSVEGGCV